jgi:hypothetical protein
MATELTVQVKGLAELRRDLRRLDREMLGEVRDTLKRGADIIARDAASLAPRRTGALAASYRAFTRGNLAGVRSNLPYAGVVEYGGTISPRGVPILFQRSAPVTRAAERQADSVAREVADGIDKAALRSGWH